LIVGFTTLYNADITMDMTSKPELKLTHEQRKTKFDKHKYGLCVACDVGLDDRADFTCDPRLPGGFAMMCNACVEYYNKNGYMSCGFGPFSNNSFNSF
jgi:hypothetical protein